MTREEAIETLKANYPDPCFEMLRDAVDVAIKALKVQTDGDTISRQAAIDTEGLDAQIRCEMCRNPMHTDRGCDGNCKYDERLYERIMQILGERIKPLPSAQPGSNESSKTQKALDTISRQAAIDAINHICPVDTEYAMLVDCELLDRVDVRCVLSDLPPSQPEIIRCKDCKFYTPMNRETKTGICRLLMHQNFGDDWYCAGAERRADG